MGIKIKNVKFQFKNCRTAFSIKPALFSIGGGSYQEFSVADYWHRATHFYFLHWCILTIEWIQDYRKKFSVRNIKK